MREKLEMSDTLTDLIVKMSEGNMGALKVLVEIVKTDPESGWSSLLDLDDMNIRGPQIWIGYKQHCEQDMKCFIESVKSRDAAMIETVNRYGSLEKDREVAVTSGGSYR